jgi:hypothetical protein
MIDLTTLPASDAERLAHAEGFTLAAKLFARIDDLEKAAETLIGVLDDIGGAANFEQSVTDFREILDRGIK